MQELESLKKCIVTYKDEQFYLVGDIFDITGIQRSYIYLLIKKKKLKALDKEGIKLIYVDSFDEYLINKNKKDVKSNRNELMAKIKSLSDAELEKVMQFIGK